MSKYSFIIIVIVAVLLTALFFQIKEQDINFSRQIFSGLVRGSSGIDRYIDWENLEALNTSVGVRYTRLLNEKERANFKKAFIKNFSFGFNRVGGRLREFRNWRIYGQDSGKIIIACDYLRYNKTLLFALSKFGTKKLIGLQWEAGK